jgi:hypothetical protein
MMVIEFIGGGGVEEGAKVSEMGWGRDGDGVMSACTARLQE